MEETKWISVGERLPDSFGWYLVAVNAGNHEEINGDANNGWRQKFGCTKAWYNPDSPGKWYEPDPHGYRSRDVGQLVTHWAELPKVPLV